MIINLTHRDIPEFVKPTPEDPTGLIRRSRGEVKGRTRMGGLEPYQGLDRTITIPHMCLDKEKCQACSFMKQARSFMKKDTE